MSSPAAPSHEAPSHSTAKHSLVDHSDRRPGLQGPATGHAEPSQRRRARFAASAEAWRWWLEASVVVGAIMGVLWWLIAPGGAFYGDGTDFHTWFARDAVLGLLLLGAGLLAGIFAVVSRGVRRGGHTGGTLDSAASLGPILAVAGFVGAVIAWRTGVFAGDLFRTPPDNMPNPSIVFSLRSGAALLLWPLASVVVVFVWSAISYTFLPAPQPQEHSAAPAAAD